MAVLFAQDYKITIGGVNLSDHITAVTLELSTDEIETTAFGSAARTRIAGLRDGSVQIDFNHDYAAANVEATLYPLLGTIATVVMVPTSGTVTATNPQYSVACLVSQHSPISAQIGDLSTFSVTWPTSGTVTKTP
jgi:hypothetical protein